MLDSILIECRTNLLVCKRCAIVAHDLVWYPKPAHNVFLDEVRHSSSCGFPKGNFSNPFCEVVSGYDNPYVAFECGINHFLFYVTLKNIASLVMTRLCTLPRSPSSLVNFHRLLFWQRFSLFFSKLERESSLLSSLLECVVICLKVIL